VTRRAQLVARCAEQRAALAAAAALLAGFVVSVDTVLGVLRRLPLLLTIYALLRRR